jgi:hypothetical protein
MCNNYMTYTMMNVPPLPDYKVVLPKGQFNGIRAHYNIRTDPDLGMGWAALHRVACGCGPCKDQLKRPWVLRGDITTQPCYAVIVAKLRRCKQLEDLRPCAKDEGGQEAGA